MQVNLQALPCSDVPVPFMIPSLSAPLVKPRSSSTKGRFCTPLKDLGDSEEMTLQLESHIVVFLLTLGH